MKEPFVHLALDPEFAAKDHDKIPGDSIGYLNAIDINSVQMYLQDIVREYTIPSKILVIHQFRESMILETSNLVDVEEVLLTIDMDGFGTSENSMFNALQCLNGASLKKVYAQFGQRDYDGTMLDLFGWFSAELTNSLFVSGVYWDDCVPECNKYLDSCYELTYMQQIWKRTGMTLTF